MVEGLDDVLEGLVELSADRVTLEWTTDGVEVTMYHGSAGVGGIVADPLGGNLMGEVIDRARLKKRNKGFLKANIHGRRMKFVAKEYDHFGDSAFEIRMRR